MRLVEVLTLLAGVGLLVFAGVQATFSRPPEAFLIAGVALMVVAAMGRQVRRFAFGASGVTIEQDAPSEIAEQVLDKDQAADLKLAISTGIPIGFAETMMGSDHVVQLTAVNTSDRPIGVNSMGLQLDNGKWAVFTHNAPYNSQVKIPGILKPQESATVYNDKDGLVRSLRDENAHVKEIVANLADGSTRRAPIPDGWKDLTND